VKRKISIELYEKHENVNFYTLQFKGEATEFDKFLDAFPEDSEYDDDVSIIIKWIDKIGEKGAHERYFRPEGRYGDSVCAIPIETCKIRLYVIRLNDNIVILGNGGIKKTDTYNEDELLNQKVKLLQEVERHLKQRIRKGIITIYNSFFYGNIEFTVNTETDEESKT